MRSNRYRVAPSRSVRRAVGGVPLALLGIAGVALWKNRERIGSLVQDLATRASNARRPAATAEVIPDDYDYNRPGVFNSTAMAGPVNGAGQPRGVDGGSMGTDLGTQGEGSR